MTLAPAALAGSPLRVGAVEDAAKWAADPSAKMALAQSAGFDSVRMTAQWSSGLTSPSSGELTNLQNAAAAAIARGIQPIVSIYNVGSSSTPADAASRAQFAQYAVAVVNALPLVTTFLVGNEPNSNLYWLPQFDSSGGDAAAQAYEQLLATTYDAIKAARPDATVVGGALDPRGGDDPASSKPTHSPTTFIRDLGAAYRTSGRTAPLMDVFDMHVYADNSSLPPSMSHPNTTTIAEADYPKLVSLLGQAFDGTAQAGSTLPILYGEFGVETSIPSTKASLYTGTEPATTKPVDEATQARYYTESFKLAMCQPNVIGIMVFHVSDESALSGWQSGPYYADDTPKSSLAAIRDAADAARAGTLTTCPDTTPPSVAVTSPASGTSVGASAVTVTATASDNVGVGRVELRADGALVATKFAQPYTFTWTPTQSGPVSLDVRAYDAAGNAADATTSVVAHLGPPDTTITAAPPSSTTATDASFSFTSSEAMSTYRCALDGAPLAACGSPSSYAGLAVGLHTFEVEAIDAAGDVDPTPATYAWAVTAVPDTTPPETTIISSPPADTSATDATFSFASSEAGSSFRCALDAAPFAACGSPVSYSGLAAGSHTFQVAATDASGNADPTPAAYSWTVEAPAPSAGGGGGSGSSGGGDPDLQVALSAEPTTAPPAGGQTVWQLTVSDAVGAQTASAVFADVTLPAGFSVTSTYSDRGSGCVAASPGLVCSLDYVGPDTAGHVTISGTVGQSGPQTLSVQVRHFLEDANPANDTATLTLPASVTSPPKPKPLKVVSPPRIRGTPRPGRTLHATAAVWSATPARVVDQWQRCTAHGCVRIRGANGLKLKLTGADAGHSVRIVATGTLAGASVTSTSRKILVARR